MTLDALLTAVFVAGACAYGLLGVRLRMAGGSRHRQLAPAYCLVGLWVAGAALKLLPAAATLTAGWLLHFLGASLLPLVLLVAARHYAGRPLPDAAVALLALLPFATLVVTATNPVHGWMWAAGSSVPQPPGWGPWFLYVHAPASYLLLGWAAATLLLHSSAVSRASRRVVLLLAATVIVPAGAMFAHDAGIGPVAAGALPLALVLLLPLHAWLLMREQIAEFTPLAYETVFQTMSDPIVVVDGQRRVIGLNQRAERLLSVREEDALRASLDSLFGPDVPEVFAALDSGDPQKMLTTSGRFLHLQPSALAGEGQGQVLMFRDVSDVEQAQQEVQSSERLLRTLIDHSINGVVRLRWRAEAGGRRLRCVFANAAAGRYLDVEPERMLERLAGDIVRLACSGMSDDEARAVVDKFVTDTRHGEVVDLETLVSANGGSVWLRVIGEPVGDNVAVTFVDVTDRKAKELQMESIAWSDPLTGVLNRRGFERDAAERLSISDDAATGALLFIDLNDFKQINDRYGHEVGDRLLAIAADRLRSTLRTCDIIGRPGGDEFVALVPDVAPELAESLATRLSAQLDEPYRIGDARLECGASIGLALYPQHANTLTGLMRAADEAMYRAKARGRAAKAGARVLRLEKAG